MEEKSIMWRYMAQEEDILRALLRDESIVAAAERLAPGTERICFVAHGSSYNAAMTAADLIARVAGVPVQAMTPANFLYNGAGLLQADCGGTLVVAISQTGTSSGVLDALREAKRLGFRTLGVTDIAASPMGTEPDEVLLLRCGEEESNAKTKGYSATLLLLMLLGIRMGLSRGTLEQSCAQAMLYELKLQAGELELVHQRVLRWCRENSFGHALRDLYVLGYGMNFGTAMEGQLKLMETACIPTMFNDIGEFSHGMHRSITEKSSLLLLRTDHPLAALMEETFHYLRGITEHTLLLDAAADAAEEAGRIAIPAHPLTQSVLLLTRAVQVLSVYAPEQQGLDPNRNAHDDFTQVVHTRV